MVKAPIEFYFDFSSPYGYLAAHRIEALGAELGLRLSRVGSIQRGEPKLVLLDESGAAMAAPRRSANARFWRWSSAC